MEKDEVTNFKLVVIAGSAGSLEIILQIVLSLPEDSDAAFLIIVHRKNDSESILENLLATRTSMKVKEVEDKESITANTIYIAPSDYHLLIEDENTFALDGSEKIHFSRPSIDVSFQSIAGIFAGASVAVLLSGANADGSEGLLKIKESGGYTIVQDPDSAEVSFMPSQAIALNAATIILSGDRIPNFIRQMLLPVK